MATLAAGAGLPTPEIEDGGGCVTVRFRPAQAAPRPGDGRDPPERQETILALLDRADDGLTLRDIQARMTPPVSERQMRRALEGLREQGLVAPGAGPRARWKRTDGILALNSPWWNPAWRRER